jgi:predicted transglutaminase-like cysteine proteinase
MVRHNGITASLSTVAISTALLIAGSNTSLQARISPRTAWPAYTVVVEKTDEDPPGWAEFCRNYKSECEAQSSTPRKLALTPELWNKLVDVNRWVNAHIKPLPDIQHFGRPNKWNFAEDGKGDCKDYVLVKRRMLLQSSLPREALLMTAVITPRNKGHAVLIVRTDKGDYVLDSLLSKIMLWKDTPYEYIMRQSQSNPNSWVYIDGDPLKPDATVDKTIAENPSDQPLVLVTGLDRGSPKQEVIAAEEGDHGTPKPDVIATRRSSESASTSEPIQRAQ